MSGPGAPPHDAIEAQREAHREQHQANEADWLEEAIFGTLDGAITAVALVVTLDVVLQTNPHTIFLTLVAAAVAGSISMYVGALLSARSRENLIHRERAREEWEVDHLPEVERREVEEIFRSQGFEEPEIRLLTDRVTSDKRRWVDLMMRDELGLPPAQSVRPGRHALIIGVSYIIGCGLLALPYLAAPSVVGHLDGAAIGSDFLEAMSLGALILAAVGVLEARFAGTHPARSAVEFIAIGLGAALAVFVVTVLLTPA